MVTGLLLISPPGSSRLHQTNDRQVRSLPTEKGAVNY